MKADVVVIGGGAAGSMCALTAAQRGLHVVLLEPNKMLGKKLRITGKGRCNVTNHCDIKTILANIPGDGRFLYSAMAAFPPEAAMAFFEQGGCPLKVERGNRVFPVSDRSAYVLNVLERALQRGGVERRQTTVTGLSIADGAINGVLTSDGPVACSTVLLCTGGASYPLTGSTGDGYRLAEQAGHTIQPPCGSLVPLVSPDEACAEMQGLSLRNTGVQLRDEKGKTVYQDFGELLFTHFGVSGPIVLSASAYVKSFPARMVIDLKPALDEKALDSRILSDFSAEKNRIFANSLSALLPRAMIPVIVKRSGIDPQKQVNAITKDERKRLVQLMHSFEINLNGTRPLDEAIITCGGVSVKEINPSTMGSKLVSGLYFAGEIIDVDAYTGGYNLTIAFSTGRLAGKSASLGE